MVGLGGQHFIFLVRVVVLLVLCCCHLNHNVTTYKGGWYDVRWWQINICHMRMVDELN